MQSLEADQRNGLCDKSRDVGVSWLFCAYSAHGWLFRDNFSAGIGSFKEQKVDRIGDPDSIFEKIRILLENLPDWMLPAGYERSKHAPFCKIMNPANGSTITGEVGDDCGRSGRKSIYLVDETAFFEHPELVERALSQNTRVRIDGSTVNGASNWFARQRFSGKVEVFTFHWKSDPRKNHAETLPDGTVVYPWYEDQKKRWNPVTIAQEIDIDYTASVEGICIPAAWVRAAVDLFPDPGLGPVVGSLDVAEFGKDVNVFMNRRGTFVRPEIHSWGQVNTTETAWRARDHAVACRAREVIYDCVGVGAGVTGPWQTAEKQLLFIATPINTGESPTDTYWPDGRTSKEKFKNLRAEIWWKARVRFEKAYEFVTQGRQHPREEMISIPNDPQLIAELSVPLVERTESGKLQLEAKAKMRKRGIKSPNYADALVLLFCGDGLEWALDTSKSGNMMESAPRGVYNDHAAARSDDDDDEPDQGGLHQMIERMEF
jgi:hypothetical protein